MSEHDPVEVWCRNPYNYALEMLEAGAFNIAWDRGVLKKRVIEPHAFGKLYFPNENWKALCIGEQGAAEIDHEHSLDNPIAVYPVWSYEDDIHDLEDLLANPLGEDIEACADRTLPKDERPIFGQRHVVVICDMPTLGSMRGRNAYRRLKDLQSDYPDATLHIHGLYSFRWMFGEGFKSIDIDARTDAAQGNILLPNGKKIKPERAGDYNQWIKLMNMKPVDLTIPRNRCIFYIKSAHWAAKYYDTNLRFKIQGNDPVDTTTPEKKYKPPTARSAITQWKKPKEGDKFVCNSCSLALNCKYFRDGSVCTMPGTEPNKLANAFGSRDVDTIIDGLGELMQISTHRLQKGLEDEEFSEELSPEVTKLSNQLFEQANKLARLIDPKRFSAGSKVNVQVGGPQVQVQQMTPQQLIGGAIQELERRGIPRDQIDSDMIQGILRGMADPGLTNRAIEGEVISDQ